MNFNSFIQKEWQLEFENDFSFMELMPSSYVRSVMEIYKRDEAKYSFDYVYKFTTHSSDISKKEREYLFHIFSEERVSSWSYLSINHLKTIIKNRLSSCSIDEKNMLEDLQNHYHNISTPTAKQIKKCFFSKLENNFNNKFKSDGGGCWSLPIKIHNQNSDLVVDFGGWSVMTYWIDVFPTQKPHNIVFASYEDIMGLSKPNWDLMRTDLMEEHSDIFLETINRTIEAVSSSL